MVQLLPLLDTLSADLLLALPQQPPMRLLSRVLGVEPGRALAEVDVEATSLFAIAGRGVPGWVALEYLGQTCALIGLAEAARRATDGLREDGFLLGSRELDFASGDFHFGTTVTIECCARGEVGGSLATFDGEVVASDGRRLAAGSLSVIRVPRHARATSVAVPDSRKEPRS